MTFKYNYYRPSVYSFELEKIETEKDNNVKIKEALTNIHNSSPTVKSLQFYDTGNLYEFLRDNNIEVNSFFNNILSKNLTNSDNRGKENEEADEEPIVNPYDQVHRFIDINEMQTKAKSYPQLVTTMLYLPKSIRTFNALIENFIEHIIKEIINVIPKCKLLENNESIPISPEFCWSYFTGKPHAVKNQIIFIYFTDAMMLYLFQYVINKMDIMNNEKKIEVFTDISYRKNVMDKIDELFEIEISLVDEIIDDLNDHFEKLKKISDVTIKRDDVIDEDDYIERCKRLRNTYVVKPKDLSDVSFDNIDVVKKELIDFRVRFIMDQYVKHDYSHIINKMKKKRDNGTVKSERLANNVDVSKAGSNISDIEYENMRVAKEREIQEKKYFTQLSSYKKKEDTRLKNYNMFNNLFKHESYVNKTIPNNRRKFLSSFVNGVVDEKNKIDKNFSYYTKHSNYVKYRLPAKEKEEKLDNEDVKTEASV